MTALDRLTLAFMQLPMTEEWRTELHQLVKEAEEEQTEPLAALREVEEWWLTQGMQAHAGAPYCIFRVRELLARFPAPTGHTG